MLSVMLSTVTTHLFSRSGMLRFLAAKHILRGMTFLSLVLFWCFGEPESSLPLKFGDWGAAPSHGRSDTKDGFLIYGVTSRMNLTMKKINKNKRLVFSCFWSNENRNICIHAPSRVKCRAEPRAIHVLELTPHLLSSHWGLTLMLLPTEIHTTILISCAREPFKWQKNISFFPILRQVLQLNWYKAYLAWSLP